MNPDAKEFVPAHILKKRQEEAELTRQLNSVDINSESSSSDLNTNENNLREEKHQLQQQQKRESGDNSLHHKDDDNSSQNSYNETQSEHNTDNQVLQADGQSCTHAQNDHNGTINNNNNNNSCNHLDNNNHVYDNGGLHGDSGDDRYLLNAGENLCEFNGEEFIIPGDGSDQDYECHQQLPPTGYDFGNAADNENEDVCNAFEEFLENLPDQTGR